MRRIKVEFELDPDGALGGLQWPTYSLRFQLDETLHECREAVPVEHLVVTEEWIFREFMRAATDKVAEAAWPR